MGWADEGMGGGNEEWVGQMRGWVGWMGAG